MIVQEMLQVLLDYLMKLTGYTEQVTTIMVSAGSMGKGTESGTGGEIGHHH